MKQKFNYEETFMGVREKSSTYFRSFKQDYRLRSLVKTVSLSKGKLLDVGCGGGILTEALPYYFPNSTIYGCDISKAAIKYAKKLGSGKVSFEVIKNNKLPYKSNFFDICICFDVLEHVPDVDFFLNEIKKVLKKRGELFLIVPCEGEPFTYTWLFQRIKLGNKLTSRFFGHIHPEFTHKYMENILKKHGFKIEKKTYSEHFFYQLLHLMTFFGPKLILELFLGRNKASEYTNSSLISHPKNKKDALFVIRNFWYLIFNLVMYYPMNWETILLKNMRLSAWKIHILARK